MLFLFVLEYAPSSQAGRSLRGKSTPGSSDWSFLLTWFSSLTSIPSYQPGFLPAFLNTFLCLHCWLLHHLNWNFSIISPKSLLFLLHTLFGSKNIHFLTSQIYPSSSHLPLGAQSPISLPIWNINLAVSNSMSQIEPSSSDLLPLHISTFLVD